MNKDLLSSANRIIDAAVISEFPVISDGGFSELLVYQSGQGVPFDIKRVFTVTSLQLTKKGEHAHRDCSQFLIALQGVSKITVFDGKTQKGFSLEIGTQGLFLPSGLWVAIEYLSPQSMIMVLCDLPYDESEYIRSWDEFLLFKELK